MTETSGTMTAMPSEPEHRWIRVSQQQRDALANLLGELYGTKRRRFAFDDPVHIVAAYDQANDHQADPENFEAVVDALDLLTRQRNTAVDALRGIEQTLSRALTGLGVQP